MTVVHLMQERPDTCVAAALRIVLAARGDLRSEADIRDQLGPFPWRVGTVVGFG